MNWTSIDDEQPAGGRRVDLRLKFDGNPPQTQELKNQLVSDDGAIDPFENWTITHWKYPANVKPV